MLGDLAIEILNDSYQQIEATGQAIREIKTIQETIKFYESFYTESIESLEILNDSLRKTLNKIDKENEVKGGEE